MFGLGKTNEGAMSFEALEAELLKGHRVFKAFECALEVVATVKGIENAGREATARLDVLKVEEETLNQAKELARADLEAAKQAASDTLATAKLKANALLKDAKDEAEDIATAAQDNLNTVNDAIEHAKNELGQLRYKVTEAQAEYDALVQKLENAKKAILSVA